MPVDTATCTKCRCEKLHNEFRPCAKKRNGLSSWCKSCHAADKKSRHIPKSRTPAPLIVRPEGYDETQRIRAHDRQLRHRYGITRADYEKMYASQGGACIICGKSRPMQTAKGLVVDHCHDTGKVRGLLCAGCNYSLGVFKDSSAVLLRAASYLQQHGK